MTEYVIGTKDEFEILYIIDDTDKACKVDIYIYSIYTLSFTSKYTWEAGPRDAS